MITLFQKTESEQERVEPRGSMQKGMLVRRVARESWGGAGGGSARPREQREMV